MSEVKTEEIRGVKHLADLKGKWKLIYTPMNTMGAEAFGGRGLDAYTDPVSGRKMHRRVAGQPDKVYNQFMISRLETILRPGDNPQHLLDIEWLIHNPNVALEGYNNLGSEWMRAKHQGSNIKLIAMDFQEVFTVDQEDEIDIIVGRISAQGKNQLSLEKIRIVLSSLGVTYRDTRYINDKTVERKILRQKLKTYAKSSIKYARLVKVALDDLEGNRDDYYIKEMIRLKVLIHANGMYKHKGDPVAATVEGLKQTWIDDPNLKEIHMKALELETVSETNPNKESFL